ncbi:MAG TPA: hypothetical protein VEH50_11690 [Methylomirabilota bacterium]|nr:hypothetical protein [Methylomirabilota bacterium]
MQTEQSHEPSRPRFSKQEKWLLLLFLLSLPLVNPWVRGDGVGYYAYVRSILIDHDIRFENDWLAANPSFLESRIDSNGHLLPDQYTPTGYVGNHFSVGPSLLWSPVIASVHGVVLALDRFGARIPADGYSPPYLISMAVTTAIYGFLGLWLSFLVARKYVGARWAMAATLGIWWASSLPVYMYFNPSWSHAHSAFGVALFLWYWDRTRSKRSLVQWVFLGLIAGLMADIYYPNAILLLLPGVESMAAVSGVSDGQDQRRRASAALLANWTLFGVAFVVALLPTLVTRKILYGTFTASGYRPIASWNWTSPVFAKVLFSSDHGLFSWTPILLLAAIGLLLLWKRDRLLSGSLILVFLAYFYFIASYPDWDGLSSYGNRFFISLTPLFILGLAALFGALGDWMKSQKRAVALAGATIGLLVIWNVGFIFQWGTHLVPARGPISWSQMTKNQFVVVPARISHSVKTYLTRRSSMMEQIEQQDIQQQGHSGDN